MPGSRKYVVELIANMINSKTATQEAEAIVERLAEEGLLHLGHGNADIDAVIEKFAETFGTTKVSRFDRFAANRLCAKYGSQAIVGIIGLLGKRATEKFAPVVNSVEQFEKKLPSILNFLRQDNSVDETIQL